MSESEKSTILLPATTLRCIEDTSICVSNHVNQPTFWQLAINYESNMFKIKMWTFSANKLCKCILRRREHQHSGTTTIETDSVQPNRATLMQNPDTWHSTNTREVRIWKAPGRINPCRILSHWHELLHSHQKQSSSAKAATGGQRLIFDTFKISNFPVTIFYLFFHDNLHVQLSKCEYKYSLD